MSEPNRIGIGFLIVVSVILFCGIWFFYIEPRQQEAAAEEAISRAQDACMTRNKIVYAQALLDAHAAIRKLDTSSQQEWEVRLSNRLKMILCPVPY